MELKTVTITDREGYLIASIASDDDKVIVADGFQVYINGVLATAKDDAE